MICGVLNGVSTGETMTRRLMAAAVVMVIGAGCLPATRIVNPDVTGPNGEHLVELACGAADQCMALARQTCGGDFDVITSMVNSRSESMMLVHCKTVRLDASR